MEPVHALEIVELAAELVRPLAAQRGITLVVDRAGRAGPRRARRPPAAESDAAQPAVERREVQPRPRHRDDRVRRRSTAAACGSRSPTPAPASPRRSCSCCSSRSSGSARSRRRSKAPASGSRCRAASPKRWAARSASRAVGRPGHHVLDRAGADRSAGTRRRTPPSRPTARDRRARDTQGVVLYIEDNRSNVRLMERLLERRPGVAPAATRPTASGSARWRAAEQPDLILLDLHLPDMPGEEVLHRLWQDAALRSIPVAILSADATAEQSRRLRRPARSPISPSRSRFERCCSSSTIG